MPGCMSRPQKLARLIAFYLPQYHPIPENDRWWGKGFTEWTNVSKARPLFPGHYQPHVPADLGFYDLRLPEARAAQAELAQNHGIEAFCYWHYWFAGKRLLERPFTEVLRTGEPNFPFCLAWANESWTGVWHGAANRMLIEQTYPGIEDHRAHFYAVLDALGDPRYVRIGGKPVFLIYRPFAIPDRQRFIDIWRELANHVGLAGIFFIGIADPSLTPEDSGFDAIVVDNPGMAWSHLFHHSQSRLLRATKKITRKDYRAWVRRILARPTVYPYREATRYLLSSADSVATSYPCILPNWDNTPRCGIRGVVLHNSSPDLFRLQVRRAIELVSVRAPDQRLVLIKSWNEWAEGNHLEPDQKFGKGYLEVVRDEVNVPESQRLKAA